MSATIDPRIRARRIAVQRDVGRKRLRRLAYAAGTTATAVGLWGIAQSPVLDVDRIEVRGASNTGYLAVAAATGIERGDALVSISLGTAASQIASLPWVETVEVERHWPGTVRVRVVERRPVAAAPVSEGGWVLLDASRQQLAVVAEPPPGVLRLEIAPVVAAPGARLREGAAAVLELAASRPAALREHLVALRPAGEGMVEGTVLLGDGATATVRFGQPTQASAKWLALLSVLDGADPAGVVAIDVRVPSAPALTRR